MLADAIRQFFAEHGLAPRRIVAAVSGGFDSTALLLALAELRDDVEVVAAHVNHHLRGADSDDDEAFVRDLCANLGVPLHIADGTLDAAAVRDRGIEAAAREIRMSRLQEIRQAADADAIATAHQKNDQAETVMMRLMTGGGIAALRGIHPVRDDGVIRPFLAVKRSDIAAFLEERSIVARVDRSNVDPRFLRNRVRAMLAQCDASVIDNLAAVAAQASEQWRVLERTIDAAEDVMASNEQTIFRSMPDDAWLRQALLLRHIRRLDSHARDVSSRDLQRLAATKIKRQNVTKSVELIRRGEEFMLRRVQRPVDEFELKVTADERVCIDSLQLTMIITRSPLAAPRSRIHFTLPLNATATFIIRNRRRGDRFQPLGMTAEIKLKDFLIKRKVPVERRDRIPLVLWSDTIVLVGGIEVSERFKLGASDRDVYAVTIAPDFE